MAKVRNDNVLLNIAQVLKELREERGLSQEEVYNETNIHIGRIETTHLNLTVSTLSALLNLFDINLSEFFKKVEDRTLPSPAKK